MASLHRDNQFKLRALSSALLACSLSLAASSVFALEEIEDESLGEATAEGIAFLPTNASFVFRGAGPNESVATLLSDRTKDTGMIRYIPVGPLTTTATSDPIYGTSTGKGDLFLYGLAVSKGDNDLNSRFNSVDPNIASWGTQLNPWLFKVQSEIAVPNFTSGAGVCTTANNAICETVSYLALEAPRYNDFYGTGTPITTNPAQGGDAYNLKLAFWADAFVRDPAVVENMTATGTQFDTNKGAAPSGSRPNRFRLQAVWDGFSLNGSQIQLFRTLAGASAAQVNGNAKDTFYNNTLGLAGVLRFNGGDTRVTGNSTGTAFRATITGSAGSRVTSNQRIGVYSPTTVTGAASQPGAAWGTTVGSACGDALQCYQLQALRTTDTYTGASFSIPAGLSALRFSTRESGVGQGILDTPAIGTGVTAPTFDPTEGLFAYGANINLVLGTLYQPLIVGKDSASNNLVLEIAAIPNKEAIYKRLYINYADSNVATNGGYSGSTCNVFKCGNNGIAGYQGTSATHSSITIGSINYNGTTNQLTAYTGADSIGVSFGALQNVASGTLNLNYYQLQARYREKLSNTQWRYYNGVGNPTVAGSYVNGATTCGTSGNTNCNEFNLAGWFNTGSISGFPGTNPTVANAAYFAGARAPGTGPSSYNNFCTGAVAVGTCASVATAVGWGPLPGANYNAANGTWLSNPAPSAPVAVGSALASNNLGSAVIDGFMVQHMKITTKGL